MGNIEGSWSSYTLSQTGNVLETVHACINLLGDKSSAYYEQAVLDLENDKNAEDFTTMYADYQTIHIEVWWPLSSDDEFDKVFSDYQDEITNLGYDITESLLSKGRMLLCAYNRAKPPIFDLATKEQIYKATRRLLCAVENVLVFN